jgi:hypothetical protein
MKKKHCELEDRGKKVRKAIWVCEWLSMTATTKSGSGSGGDSCGFARHLFPSAWDCQLDIIISAETPKWF